MRSRSRYCISAVLLVLAVTAASAEDAMDRIRRAMEQNRTTAPDIHLPASDLAMERAARDALMQRLQPDADLLARAKAAMAAGDSAVLRQAQQEALRQLTHSLGLADGEVAQAPPANRVTPILFVSSSMPIEVLRTYAAQLEPLHGAMLFRGAPGGMRHIRPFADLAARILRRDPECRGGDCAMVDVPVTIDPMAFRLNDVAQVPAFTILPGDATSPYCERADENAHGAHLVYGDSAIDGLLDEYARLGGGEEVRHVRPH